MLKILLVNTQGLPSAVDTTLTRNKTIQMSVEFKPCSPLEYLKTFSRV